MTKTKVMEKVKDKPKKSRKPPRMFHAKPLKMRQLVPKKWAFGKMKFER
nr:hypothetical protein 17 [Gammaproteobacteria bacterium]